MKNNYGTKQDFVNGYMFDREIWCETTSLLLCEKLTREMRVLCIVSKEVIITGLESKKVFSLHPYCQHCWEANPVI